MGKMAETLRRSFSSHINKKIIDISSVKEGKKMATDSFEALKEIKNEVNTGKADPLHYAYASSVSLISHCMYALVGLKEMKGFRKATKSQEELYMPSYPPMSPLTDSYYCMWELADFRFGSDRETLCSIFLDLADTLKISSDDIKLAKIISNSRMGIYEICKIKRDKIFFKELLSDECFWCVTPDYKGSIGDVWYTRILSSPPEYADYSISLTTPYVLLSEKKDWVSYFKRNDVNQQNLHQFMKFGPSKNYWNEYIFYGYTNYTDQAIFLKGIPDIPYSLPCRDEYDETRKVSSAFDKVKSNVFPTSNFEILKD